MMKQEPDQETPYQPCLRGDLEFSRNIGGDANIIIVKDPVSGRFHRFGPVEDFILHQLDGKTDLDQIRDRTEQQFGAELDRETLEAFVGSLRGRGLLAAADMSKDLSKVEGGWRQKVRSRIRGSLLYLRFNAFDPDQKLERMLGRLGFCFTRRFVVASIWLILLALLTLISNSDEFGRDFAGVFQPGSILPALAIVLLTTIGHEFAHGLTCKYYGGQVHEMGFLLLFFQPALYCNVSDAWLFPEKSKRIWVGMAGTYFELVLWAVAVFVWRITAPETALNFIALVLLGTSGMRIFLNLNPLIKLDGYYVLSDWLEIPNLRARAFAFIRLWLRRPWSTSRINLPVREKRIYLWYGLFAMTFTVWILTYITSAIAGFLTGALQGTGFVIFVGLLAIVFHKPIIGLWRRMLGDRPQTRGVRT
ncbi:MAG: hypothetical protein IID51_06585 [Proteobacteria bacterium]|nr:hypothetical protein [Pseudomonadota bacterium]